MPGRGSDAQPDEQLKRHVRHPLVVALVVCGAAFAAAAVWGYFSGPGTGNADASVGALTAPGKPSGSVSTGTVSLTWPAAAVGGAGTISYTVERRPQPGSTWTTVCSTTSTSCNDTPGANGTYVYRATATFHSFSAVSVESDPVVVNVPTATVGTPSPTSGNVGSSVAITGSNFAPNAPLSVTVGGVGATITAGAASNGSGAVNATFVVPALPAAAYAVAVSDGVSSAISATNFTVTRSISLAPTSGAVASTATVSGFGFPASSAVAATWDGGALTLTPASSTDASGSFSSLSFTVPGATPGAHTVAVTAGGQSTSATFTVTYPACTVTSPPAYISVATGDWATGSTWAHCVAGSWTSDATTPTSASGAIVVQGGNTVSAAGAVTVDEVTVASVGALVVNSGGTLTVANGTGTDLQVNGAVSVYGTVTLSGFTALDTATGATTAIKSGGLLQGGGGNAAATPQVTASGTLVIESGGTSTGTSVSGLEFTANSGGVVTVDGSVGGSTKTLTASTGSTVNVTGTVTLAGVSNLTVASGANLNLSGTAAVSGTRGNGGNVITVNGTCTVTDTATISALAVGTMTVANGGTIDLGASAKVAGNIFTLASGGTVKIASTSGIASSGATGNVQTSTRNFNTGANYVYDGTAAQVTGNALPSTVDNLTFANPSGATLSAATTATGTLDLGTSPVSTGANTLTVSSANAVARTSGYIDGNLRLAVATGSNVTRTFPVGTAGGYTPVTVVFSSVTTPGNLTVKPVAGDSANIGTSTLVAARSLNRHWTLTNSAIVFTAYSAAFGFPGAFGSGDAQLDPGTNTANLRVGAYNSPTWTYPTLGTRTATSTQATGITTFGAFQLAE